jgi:hypothetical protein
MSAKKSAAVLPVLLALSLGAFLYWLYECPSGTWRYRTTVIVETPEGIRTGSAVREVFAYRYPTPFPEDPGAHIRLTYGEAVVIDLGKRGVLFALQSGFGFGEADYSTRLPFWVFSSEKGALSAESIRRFSTLKAGPAEVKTKWYPNLVYFKDINNPKTVTRARDFIKCPSDHNECSHRTSGGAFLNTMEDAFGAGVRIESITLETTEDPVTKGIVGKYLPWLEEREKIKLGTLGGGPETPLKDPIGLWISTTELKTRD